MLCSLKREEEETKTTKQKKKNLGVGLMRDVTFITEKLIKTFAAPKVLRVPANLVVEGGEAKGQKV
jgi:hypothetical protein